MNIIKSAKKKLLKFVIFIILFYIDLFYYKNSKEHKYNLKKRIGIVSVLNEQNAGNNLVKFSMFIKLREYGFSPTIISYTLNNQNIDFLRKTVKLQEIKEDYFEVNRKDYDILMVNSDQTWNNYNIDSLFNHGFLRFAQNWSLPKFVYGASLGIDYWRYNKDFDEKAKILLKNFTGISVREKGAINLIESHFGIKPIFVLDPTFLIDKKYYLDIIKNFKKGFDFNKNYIFVYILDKNDFIERYIKEVKKLLDFEVYRVEIEKDNYTENFIFGVNISTAVLTDSFHGTIFSIIFNKPFISFINSNRGRLRFYSLIETFNLKNRIIFPSNETKPSIDLLFKPLNINQTFLNIIKNESINFLEKNLGIN